jgi:Flp pilus assembly protein TadG
VCRTTVCRLRRAISRFRGDLSGNIAVIFGIAILPVLGFVGAAVDYSRVNLARSAMQGALDSAVLMVSKNAPQLNAEQITTQATSYFNALYTVQVGDPQLSFIYTPPGPGRLASVAATSSGDVSVPFMGMVGRPKMTVKVASATAWSSSRMRVALALDNTGSMDKGNKMPALKTAAKTLVDTLKNTAGKDGDVYISVVPFAKDVNVGTSFYNETWIDWTDWNDDSGNKSCNKSGKNCTLNAKSTWNGCVTDRTQPNDTTVTAATGTATKFPAEQYSACPAPILPLTYTWSDVTAKIDGMSPNGMTNQPIGLVWAWWTLSAGTPFAAPAKDPDYDYIDAIVLLTDGANTEDRWYNKDSQIDARQKILCDNIKAAKVILYAIR